MHWSASILHGPPHFSDTLPARASSIFQSCGDEPRHDGAGSVQHCQCSHATTIDSLHGVQPHRKRIPWPLWIVMGVHRALLLHATGHTCDWSTLEKFHDYQDRHPQRHMLACGCKALPSMCGFTRLITMLPTSLICMYISLKLNAETATCRLCPQQLVPS